MREREREGEGGLPAVDESPLVVERGGGDLSLQHADAWTLTDVGT